MKTKTRELNLAELNRQLKRAQDELRLLEHQAQWGDQSGRWGIAHYRERIVKLTKSIKEICSP